MVGGLAPLLLVVLAALALRRWRSASLSGAERWVLAPAVGLGGSSLLFFWWRVAGLPPGALAVPLLALALLLAAASGGVPSGRRAPRSSRWSVDRWALALAIGVALVVCVLRLLQQPLGEYDAVAIWNARALTIWRAAEPMGALFFRQTLSQAHPDYPLLLPGSVAASFAVGGGETVLVPQVTSVLFLFAAAAAIWLGVHRVAGAPAARWAAALFLVTPEVLFWGPAQCADLPLAYLLVLTALGLARELESDRGPAARAALTGFSLGLLPWTKNEGLLLAALLLAAWLATGLLSRALEPRRLAALGAGALPGIATLTAFKILWSPHAELPDFLRGALARSLDPERWRVVLGSLAGELDPFGAGDEWSLTALALLVLGGVGWATHRGADPPRLFLRLALGGSLLLWLAVYVGTPADLRWHLSTSLDRLLLQILPLAFLWAFSENPPAQLSSARA
ncbi:MAG: glycosyltransferase family 39 protein [Thermoanaerobaculia bacterium]